MGEGKRLVFENNIAENGNDLNIAENGNRLDCNIFKFNTYSNFLPHVTKRKQSLLHLAASYLSEVPLTGSL